MRRSLGSLPERRTDAWWRSHSASALVARAAAASIKIGTDQVVDGGIAFGFDALKQVAVPGLKVVDPALNFESVAAQLADAE